MEMSKNERFALIALYPVMAIELFFLAIATASFFFKGSILTKYLMWRGSWIWLCLGLFFICMQILMLIQTVFIARGKRPPLSRKSDWALSENRSRRQWLVYSWNSEITTAVMLIGDFAVNEENKWDIIPIIVMALLIICSFILRKTIGKKTDALPKTDLRQE